MNADDKRLLAIIDDVNNVARVMERIAFYSKSDVPVLLVGPRNSGATFLAEALHGCSMRRNCSFVRARCGLYSGMLLEAQLFGRSSVRNGYLRATMSRREGIIGTANGGSLFVEQIQNTAASLQTRLLELLTHQEYADFEQTSIYSADVRLIVSARRGLEYRVKSGLFQENLFSHFKRAQIELTGNCTSRDGILAVIDLLRAEAAHQTTGGTGRLTEWWLKAASSAIRTPTSAVLRRALESVAPHFTHTAPVEAVFLAALRQMCHNSSEERRFEIVRSLGGNFAGSGRFPNTPAIAV